MAAQSRRSKGKRTRAARRKPAAPRRRAQSPAIAPSQPDDEIVLSGSSLHDLFQQQTAALLDRTDLDEEQKQSILVAMNCPCCGAGGLSFTAKIKRRT
jgi:hypothetical protein